MPNYYNPYNFYPASYPAVGQASFSPYINPQLQMPQQSYAPAQQQGPKMMEWVEGEVGAKAYQMPNGWPANSPIPLWDSTDTVIWLKSWGPMGIPNPLQKITYVMPEQQNQAMLVGGNGQSGATQPDLSQFVTKQDMEQMKQDMEHTKQDLMNAMNAASANRSGYNQNGNQNRGVNK